MIDREARDRLALHVRRLAAGRMSTSRFTSRAINTRTQDPAVLEIYETIDYCFCDDLNLLGTRLVGNRKLTPRWRRYLAKCVLFLRSDEESVQPLMSQMLPWCGKQFVWEGYINDLHDLMTMPLFDCGFGRKQRLAFAREWRTAMHQMGPERRAWPFASRADLDLARAGATYLCGVRRSA